MFLRVENRLLPDAGQLHGCCPHRKLSILRPIQTKSSAFPPAGFVCRAPLGADAWWSVFIKGDAVLFPQIVIAANCWLWAMFCPFPFFHPLRTSSISLCGIPITFRGQDQEVLRAVRKGNLRNTMGGRSGIRPPHPFPLLLWCQFVGLKFSFGGGIISFF